MTSASTQPGGLSAKEFELYVVEIGQWLWGTAQGAFNEKQTLSQIITDAGIGMVPLVGDITAIRDLMAISSGLVNEPEKRQRATEWVLLVIFIFALIPVLGGVIKGVGRIALRVSSDIAKDTAALTGISKEVLEFLNRVGHKNEQFWFKTMDVMSYQKDLIKRFGDFCDMIILAIHRYGLSFKAFLPQDLVMRMEQLSNGFKVLKEESAKMIPQALKELHQKLEQLQKLVRNGGVPPVDSAKTIAAQTGQKTVSYAEEARLIESGAAKKIVHAGKYPQNVANTKNQELSKIYKHEKGFPDLTLDKDIVTVGNISYHPKIAAASGPIKNEVLQGETLFRAFGENGVTHGFEVNKSNAIGGFWGRGVPPRTAEEWRQKYAVIDEWNRNGWLSLVHIPSGVKIPACTSTVSEQFSKNITGQFLEGGGQQAFITAFSEKHIQEISQQLFKRGGGKESIVLKNGQSITIEVKPSNWEKVNETIGYGNVVIPGAAITERLGLTELQSKVAERSLRQSATATSKERRASENR